MKTEEPLLPKHGGYRRLKSFQMAQLVYDVTVRFCELYVDRFSRTRDQMVQAARSGVQNIAEGSQVSATSKKMEIKLTSVARASLEELRLDYEDFLRQRNLPRLPADHPALQRFKQKRCFSLAGVQGWVAAELAGGKKNTDAHGLSRTDTDESGAFGTPSVGVRARPCPSLISPPPLSSPALAANAALALLNLACFLLDRQLASQADDFREKGGFTERLHRVRSTSRSRKQ
ncbi:MAG: four helix bundle suffix domain-containing protein [Thermodesulfobacteriota bacterium]